MQIKKGMYKDSGGRIWQVYFYDKFNKQYRAIMIHKNVLHSKKEYYAFNEKGSSTTSKYKLVAAI